MYPRAGTHDEHDELYDYVITLSLLPQLTRCLQAYEVKILNFLLYSPAHPVTAVILLSFVLAVGFLLIILSCALWQNWLPLLVGTVNPWHS
jgi:hypothetical protein